LYNGINLKKIKMEEIRKTIKDFFYFIDPDIRVSFYVKESNSLFVDVKMKDPQVLIGEKGQVLFEIEGLIKKVVFQKKGRKEPLFINLDINDYKKRKADYLKDLAREAAEEVFFTGVEKEFPPMSPFERRVIHHALSQKRGIVTESFGEGSQRRVLIRKKKEEEDRESS